jgi:hyperosmotically inducible protein
MLPTSIRDAGPDVAQSAGMTRLLPILICTVALTACSTAAKAPDFTDSIHQALVQGELKDVSVSQDRDKGVVTLSGHVASAADKAQAESIAKAQAPTQIIANQIVVTPPGGESDAKTISSSFDDGIQNTLKAELLKAHADQGVHYAVKAGVVTLTGAVASATLKTKAATIASEVPNVTQVINELTIK